MKQAVKEDILSVLYQVAGLLEQDNVDIVRIKDLSNHTIHNVSIFQDEDSITTAILIYALSKVIEKGKGKLNFSQVIINVKETTRLLEKGDIANYRRGMKRLFKILEKLDNLLKLHIQEVIERAQIKKGERIYAQGISTGRTAEILGISQWELINYIGKKDTYEMNSGNVNVTQRVAFARGLFK